MIKKIIYDLFGIRIIHIIRRSIFFCKSPVIFFKELLLDLKKDKSKIKHKYHLIWCPSLPKSGSTLIEEIIECTNYVQLNFSSLRIYDDFNLDDIHGVSDKMFQYAPIDKNSYVKTHSHYSKRYIDVAKKNKAKIIISYRDLRDMMISQYFHILNDPSHWQHKLINKLNFAEGLILTFKKFRKKEEYNLPPLRYYFKWVVDWKNNSSSEYLFIKYEEYISNPIDYIKKILNFLEIKDIEPQLVEEKINLKRNSIKKMSLQERLEAPGRKNTTFREGKSDNWKKYFTPKIEEEFFKIISKKEYFKYF